MPRCVRKAYWAPGAPGTATRLQLPIAGAPGTVLWAKAPSKGEFSSAAASALLVVPSRMAGVLGSGNPAAENADPPAASWRIIRVLFNGSGVNPGGVAIRMVLGR